MALCSYGDVKTLTFTGLRPRCRAAELSRAERGLLCMHLAGHASQLLQRYTKLGRMAGRPCYADCTDLQHSLMMTHLQDWLRTQAYCCCCPCHL